ncbi:MAG: 2-amino-4-hydroxy-6-hydroxymethyldihyropteridine pyrophosphokinase [uncultured bacterium]|nr:MAG: 2-amino-4-hydroxy-6-hydroxymethyldihyropteridine pyrophosphokinase [uncultured bacterium]
MNIVYIGLGSNLNSPLLQLQMALEKIKKIPQTFLKSISSFYLNPPLGDQKQADYVNAVIKVETQLDFEELFFHLMRVEEEQGRVRTQTCWQPRTLDLDLLLFNKVQIETEKIILPHPGLMTRSFVIYPLLEIEKDLILPQGIVLNSLRERVKNNLIPIFSPIFNFDETCDFRTPH